MCYALSLIICKKKFLWSWHPDVSIVSAKTCGGHEIAKRALTYSKVKLKTWHKIAQWSKYVQNLFPIDVEKTFLAPLYSCQSFAWKGIGIDHFGEILSLFQGGNLFILHTVVKRWQMALIYIIVQVSYPACSDIAHFCIEGLLGAFIFYGDIGCLSRGRPKFVGLGLGRDQFFHFVEGGVRFFSLHTSMKPELYSI